MKQCDSILWPQISIHVLILLNMIFVYAIVNVHTYAFKTSNNIRCRLWMWLSRKKLFEIWTTAITGYFLISVYTHFHVIKFHSKFRLFLTCRTFYPLVCARVNHFLVAKKSHHYSIKWKRLIMYFMCFFFSCHFDLCENEGLASCYRRCLRYDQHT